MELSVERTSTAPPDAVWAVMTDIESSAEVLSGVTLIERLDGGRGFGPGLCWRETRVMMGREATEEMEVTEVDESARRYVVVAHSKGVDYRSVLAVDEADGGSRLSMTFAGEPKGVGGRLLAATLGRAFQGATRKALEQDLADIAAAAEARS